MRKFANICNETGFLICGILIVTYKEHSYFTIDVRTNRAFRKSSFYN